MPHVTPNGLHTGKIAPKTTYEKHVGLCLADFLPGLKAAGRLPSLPSHDGHGNDFLGEAWGMMGNGPDNSVFDGFAGAGDCAWADPAHSIMEDASNTGRPVPSISGATTIKQYSEYTLKANGTAFNPSTGTGDTGSSIQEVLEWRKDKGFYDDDGNVYKIEDFVRLEPKNPEELFYGAWLFNHVSIGIEFPETADTQFSKGEVWTPVKGAEIVGGHDIAGMGSPDNKTLWAFITWAKRTLASVSFYTTYNDETWAYLSEGQFTKATGKTYEGYNAAQLEEYLHLVAALKMGQPLAKAA